MPETIVFLPTTHFAGTDTRNRAAPGLAMLAASRRCDCVLGKGRHAGALFVQHSGSLVRVEWNIKK